ncbi:unnamed protein product, partial [Coffea canephora]
LEFINILRILIPWLTLFDLTLISRWTTFIQASSCFIELVNNSFIYVLAI